MLTFLAAAFDNLVFIAERPSMGRPLTATDDDILAAARRVLERRGLIGFSVAEVAREVGLSRAAINQRFHSARSLQKIILDQLAEEFETVIASFAFSHGGAGLIEIAGLIGRMSGTRAHLRANLGAPADVEGADYRELEQRRGSALKAAIAAVMPVTAVAKDDSVDLFLAHLSGSQLAWLSGDGPDSAESFLRERTALWLVLAGVSD